MWGGEREGLATKVGGGSYETIHVGKLDSCTLLCHRHTEGR